MDSFLRFQGCIHNVNTCRLICLPELAPLGVAFVLGVVLNLQVLINVVEDDPDAYSVENAQLHSYTL